MGIRWSTVASLPCRCLPQCGHVHWSRSRMWGRRVRQACSYPSAVVLRCLGVSLLGPWVGRGGLGSDLGVRGCRIPGRG